MDLSSWTSGVAIENEANAIFENCNKIFERLNFQQAISFQK